MKKYEKSAYNNFMYYKFYEIILKLKIQEILLSCKQVSRILFKFYTINYLNKIWNKGFNNYY